MVEKVDIPGGSVADTGSTSAKGLTNLRIKTSLRQFLMFGIVGGSGTVVNLAVVYVTTKLAGLWGISEHDVFFNLFGTQFNIRWYHVFLLLAFLVANTWNYQLNRSWTFRGVSRRSWLRGYFPFLATGLVSLVVSQIVATLLMNPTSPVALPADIFDDSTGLRTKFYWASAISIVVAMPVNFVINKLWAFSKPKTEAIVEVAPY